MGGNAGAGGIAGVGFDGAGTLAAVGGIGGAGDGDAGDSYPPFEIHEGIRGLPPPEPLNEFEVPISVRLAYGS